MVSAVNLASLSAESFAALSLMLSVCAVVRAAGGTFAAAAAVAPAGGVIAFTATLAAVSTTGPPFTAAIESVAGVSVLGPRVANQPTAATTTTPTAIAAIGT